MVSVWMSLEVNFRQCKVLRKAYPFLNILDFKTKGSKKKKFCVMLDTCFAYNCKMLMFHFIYNLTDGQGSSIMLSLISDIVIRIQNT